MSTIADGCPINWTECHDRKICIDNAGSASWESARLHVDFLSASLLDQCVFGGWRLRSCTWRKSDPHKEQQKALDADLERIQNLMLALDNRNSRAWCDGFLRNTRNAIGQASPVYRRNGAVIRSR